MYWTEKSYCVKWTWTRGLSLCELWNMQGIKIFWVIKWPSFGSTVTHWKGHLPHFDTVLVLLKRLLKWEACDTYLDFTEIDPDNNKNVNRDSELDFGSCGFGLCNINGEKHNSANSHNRPWIHQAKVSLDLSLSHYQACSFDSDIVAINPSFIDVCTVHVHC